MGMIGHKDIEKLIAKWQDEAVAIAAELQVLKNADAILGDNSLRHSVELWEMKLIRLQRCVIDLQQLVMARNCEAMRILETANASLNRQGGRDEA